MVIEESVLKVCMVADPGSPGVPTEGCKDIYPPQCALTGTLGPHAPCQEIGFTVGQLVRPLMNKTTKSPLIKSEKVSKLLSLVAAKFGSPEEVACHVRYVNQGFEPWEQEVVQQFMQKPGRLLDIGCGAGREAFAFARLGFEVAGIDIAPEMIEEAKDLATENGVEVDFETCSVTEVEYPPASLDYIFFSRAVYSYIPTRELRVATLRRLRRMLKPSGLLILSAYFVARRRLFCRRTLTDFYRTMVRKLFGPGMALEPGDSFVGVVSEESDPNKPCFVHIFTSRAKVSEELREAGFSILGEGGFYWIAQPNIVGCEEDVRLVKSSDFALLASELLDKGVEVRFAVTGSSMRPSLEDGDRVTLAPVNPETLKIGDLVLFRRQDESLVLHRLVKRKGGPQPTLIFKGDAVAELDEPVGPDQVLATVIKIERLGQEVYRQGPASALLNRLLAEYSMMGCHCRRTLNRMKSTWTGRGKQPRPLAPGA